MAFLRNFIGSSSYREAQAWAFVVVNSVVITVYCSQIIANVPFTSSDGISVLAGLITVLVSTTFFTLVLIIPTAIVFNRTANERADERDKRIHVESRAIAFWPLFWVTSLALVAYVLHRSGDLLFHSVMIAILLSQLVYALICSVKYRRSGAPLFEQEQV